MIVQKIHLENWKIFREPFEVEFSEGLNVLYGPNESGKTTLIDSIRTVFFSRHTSRSERIRALVPWGSSLVPCAQITFLQNGHSYRVSKRFLSPQSLLERLVEGAWERVAEGDRADEEVLKLVGGRFPGRGDTRPQFWGLGQALWMVQGQPFISEELNEETLSQLQRLIGAAIETPEERDLFRRIRSRFLDIFTERKREFRKDSAIARLRDQIGRLEEERARLQRLLEDKEELIRRIEDNEILLQRREKGLRDAHEELNELRKQVELAHRHRADRERLEEEVKRLFLEYRNLKLHLDSIREAQKSINARRMENEALKKEKKALEGDLEKLRLETKALAVELEKVIGLMEKNEEDLRYARTAHNALSQELELRAMVASLEKMERLKGEVGRTRKELEGLKAPSQDELEMIEGLHAQIRDLRTRLDAVGLTIQAVAQADIKGMVRLDSDTQGFTLNRGQDKAWKAHQRVRIEIEGVAGIEIKSGSEDVMKMRERLEALQVELEKALAPYPTSEICKLRELHNRKTELERDLKRLKAEIEQEAPGGEDELKRAIAERKTRTESSWRQLPEGCGFRGYSHRGDKTAARDELAHMISRIETQLEELRMRRKGLEEKARARRETEEAVVEKIRGVEMRIHGNKQQIELLEATLEKLKKEGPYPEEGERRLDELSVELDSKTRALKRYRDEMGELEEKPVKALEGCEARGRRLQEEVQRLKISIAEDTTRLKETLSGLGDATKIEEELEFLRQREASLETEAHAVALLNDLVNFYRGKAIEGLTDPVRKMVTEDLRVLLGPRYRVILDEGVKPVSVEVHGWGTDAPLDLLSFGTQEQIWFLFRIALGRLLSGEQRQLVVLDDPLVNTDPGRLHRALRIIEDASSRLQLVILTCDRDKYNPLSSANFISLEGKV